MIYTVTLNPTIDRTMLFARLEVGALNRAERSHTDLSGKGVNVSIALRRFGLESTLWGFVAGTYGRLLVSGLESQGYRCAFDTVQGETRSNVTVIDQASGVTTKLNEPGPTINEADLVALEERMATVLQADDLVVMSGSLPPGAPVDTYARLIAVIQAQDAIAALDTSGPALEAGCRARPDWIKPNDVEAEALTGSALNDDTSIRRALEAMHRLGPKRILLSLGARGAILSMDDHAWWATPPVIQEVSAIAAGDASFTGCLWASQQGLPGDCIARWAVAAGTATAMVDGSAVATREQMEQVYRQVTVRSL